MKFSVVIAAKDEAKNIEDCIASCKDAEEIIVVDDNSTDQTSEVASKLGAKIFKRTLDGFASQKNYGISKTTYDWVLILDADEQLSQDLRREILDLAPPPTTAAFSIPFRNYIGKKWLRHGGLYPDRHIRLFRKRAARYGAREVHEELVIEGGRVEELSGEILHYTYSNMREYWHKVRQYSIRQAAEDAKIKAIRFENPIKAMIRELIFRLFKLHGYRDGLYGLASAGLLGIYQYLYMKEARKHI